VLRSCPDLLLGSGLRQLVLQQEEALPRRPVRQPLQEAWLPCQEELLQARLQHRLLELLDLRWRLGCPGSGPGRS